MNTDYFFGYGSLVNRQTHDYPHLTPARVRGWRRMWQPSPLRPVAFLSVVTAPGEWVLGAIAQVPGADWQALDIREAAYQRRPVSKLATEHSVDGADVQIYAVETPTAASPDQPILLSYIDAVIQGFLAEHGPKGAEEFFETTVGWETPVRNDRYAPEYPRHQTLTDRERDIVDANLRVLSAMVE